MATATKKRPLTKMANGCWRKHYQGKKYYFPAKLSEKEALQEWEKKKYEVDNGLDDWRVQAKKLVDYCNEKKDKATIDEMVLIHGYHPPEGWNDPLQEAKPATICTHITDWLNKRKNDVVLGKIKPCTWDNLKFCIKQFSDFCGSKTLADINSKLLEDFFNYLLDKIKAKEIGNTYATDCMRDVSQFLNDLWRMELIELPRNLGHDSLSFGNPIKEIRVFTKEEIKTLLSTTNEKLKLCCLLMLNCGMYQQDISDLKQSEVDWTQGIITRKRSKTQKHDTVPTVSYKLWTATFTLLKKYNSGKENVLANEKGGTLVSTRIDGDKAKKSDCIKNWYRRFQVSKKLKLLGLKHLRKTSATTLNEKYNFAPYFLGHSPRTIADINYVKPSNKQFQVALAWLGKELLGKD